MNFEQLVVKINENQNFRLNQAGIDLIQKYHNLIQQIEKTLIPVLSPYVRDPDTLTGEIAVQIISSINSKQLGSKEFELMTRLDTLTSGGQNEINGASFTFNPQDLILKYIDPI